ncbi:ATP-binding protein [Pseudomonas putida]|uniref:sensor histidine kinase n=1 Tax=Pseudomonas putida TaxID=303 RepID=UPI00334E38C6
MKRLLPRSLQGRLILILVVGVLGSQILTSSIWFEMRQTQVLEIPLRLFAARMADVVRVAQNQPDYLDDMLESMESPNWHRLPSSPTGLKPVEKAQQKLLNDLLAARIGNSAQVRLLRLDVRSSRGEEGGLRMFLEGSPATVFIQAELSISERKPIIFEASEEQGWQNASVGTAVLDFILRVYLLRTIAVVLIALVAVRLALRPLKQMATAAEALGQDIHRPPLSLDGPQEVHQAAQAFNVMQRRLIESISERTRFFAAVSHDLRTPITRLRLRTELLPDEVQRQRFRSDLLLMEEMVSAILDFLRSGELESARELLDVDALLEGLQADFRDLGCEVMVEGKSKPYRAHAIGMRRCLQNILDNARRHAPGPIDILVHDSLRKLRIQIGDRGPGIEPEHLTKVMEPFYQADPSRSCGGHGLGLSIAASIANAHGGRLELAPRIGGGLLVTLELPRPHIQAL